MKKVLVLLLVVGVLIGTFATVEMSEEISFDHGDFSQGEDIPDSDSAPCGGGDGAGPGGAPG